MKTLVISSCTAKKKYKHINQLIESDFINTSTLKEKEENLKYISCIAKEMYIGNQHLSVVNGIESLRNYLSEDKIDFYIISAGYGLIKEDTIIAPYNVTFQGKKLKDIKELSRHLNINKDLQNIINEYDLVIILLGIDYIKALEVEKLKINTKTIFFAPKTVKKIIPCRENIFIIEAGEEQRKKQGCMGIDLKGVMFNVLAKSMIKNELSFRDIIKNPILINDLI